MATINVNLNENQAHNVAVGDGNVTITPRSYGCEWALSDSTAAPAISYWHVARANTDISMSLKANERLWVRGKGTLVVSADIAA